jgi:transcription antitermination factor NusA-like protein
LRFRIANFQTKNNIDMKKKTNKLAQFKQWILSIVMPGFSQDLEQAKKVKHLFLSYFDGCYEIDAVENTPNTFAMGVCKLEYKDNTLTVHLRRPGLLIGKGGRTINALAKYLECKIDIVEVNLLK